MAAPDFAGFRAAQLSQRENFGSNVTFKVPVAPTWPEGTKLNPDTGLPYDATIQPTSAAFTDVVKRCHVVLKQASPLRPQPDTEVSAAGNRSGMDIIIDIGAADYPAVEEAVEMVAAGLTYRVKETKPFEAGGEIYRYLIYGMEM